VRADRLLHVEPSSGALAVTRVGELPGLLRPGDLLVVNDAATLPASLSGVGPGGAPVELRLAGATEDGSWSVVAFGAGDWRGRTEDRPPPPALAAGDHIAFGGELRAEVIRVSPLSPRLLDVSFEPGGDGFWAALYRRGRPVQYSYLDAPLALWHVQTAYASRPWAVELPSAGRPLNGSLLLALRRRFVGVAALTHAAGLSATGDPALDAALPLPERYEIPAETAVAVARAREARRRVVAVGTTVVRALEGAAARRGILHAGAGVTDLRVGEGFRPRVVDGVFTGMHEPGTSHFELLAAFAPRPLLERAHALAEESGFLAHEFGDSMLILRA
jgi:S-adenosylmethionine:tRNA ribosyltransferase-isomerase